LTKAKSIFAFLGVQQMNETVKKAADYYAGGLYCSQAVLGAFCEKYGLDKETALRISFGLNSGVRRADVCGAVTGAIMVVGLKYGVAKDIGNTKTEEYIKHFIDINKSIVCRDLLHCDISTSDGREQALRDNLFKTRCLDLVTSAADLLVDLGY
jgi:C_GCAxxG_C_C family probable redox protein